MSSQNPSGQDTRQDTSGAPPPRRSRLRADQRRDAILTAATEVFSSAGYRAGKVSDIAARLGVSEPVIFQNFGSKAALYGEVLSRVADGIRSELPLHTGHHGPVADLLARLLAPGHDGGPHAPGSPGVLFADAATLIGDPELAVAARQVLAVVGSHLADLIRTGQEEGGLRDDLDPDVVAWLVVSLLSARPLRAAAVDDPDGTERGLAAFVLEAVAPPRPA